MKPFAAKVRVYYFSSFFLTALNIILFVTGFLTAFDFEIGYFKTGTLIPSVAKYLLIFTLLWIISLFIFIPKKSLPYETPFFSTASKIASSTCIIALITAALLRIKIIPNSVLSIIINVLTLISAIFFALNAFFPDSYGNYKCISGIVVTILAALYMAEAYTNQYVEMNSPIKLLLMFSMMSVMIFMLYETNYAIGRSRPRAFMASGLIGICLSGIFSVGFTVLWFCKKSSVNEFLPTAIFSLSMTLYMICRSFDFLRINFSDAPAEQTESTEIDASSDAGTNKSDTFSAD